MPPLAVAEHVNGLPVVRPVVGHAMAFVTGWPPTVAVVEAAVVTPLALLAVLLIE